jgi:S-adenosylmethionine:tRNA ribosyltransferase-isomerase
VGQVSDLPFSGLHEATLKEMLLSEFDYALPHELIAQQQLEDRAASRMLVLDRARGSWEDRHFTDFPSYLHPGDCLVLNDSRVFPSRLIGRREHGTGRVEVFLVRPLGDRTWEALVHPGRKMRTGERIVISEARTGPARLPEPSGTRDQPAERAFLKARSVVRASSSDDLTVEILARGEHGQRTVRLCLRDGLDLDEVLDRVGHTPLPPYIRRPDTQSDRERYQTVYAREQVCKDGGSVAAPTAGLHFTPEILDRCRAAGAEIARVTLHVGLGTFQPLHTEVIEEVRLHKERFEVTEEAARTMDRAARVVAVGTTSVRAIESGGFQPETDLFISPGFSFRRTGALLTNFHLPRSSLLVLVCALAGTELTLAAYRHAVEQRYRFFSYGDCMLIL